MDWLYSADWQAILMPDTPLLEIFVRGSLMYLAIFCLMRFVLKRQAGSMNMGDLLLIVLIADAAQNGMSANYNSVPDGILLVSTLIFWNYILDWLGYHFPAFEKILSPPPLPLVKHGRMIYKNMRSELISEEDLKAQLRLQGVDNIKNVKRACMEGEGKISVVTYENNGQHSPPEATPGAG